MIRGASSRVDSLMWKGHNRQNKRHLKLRKVFSSSFILQSCMHLLTETISILSFLKLLFPEKVNLDSACDISMSHSAKPPLSWSRRSNIYSTCGFPFIITTPEVKLNPMTSFITTDMQSKVILCTLRFLFLFSMQTLMNVQFG